MNVENDPHLQHLFDGGDLNVYSTDFTSLSVGAPGPDLLRFCVNMFKEATTHRMTKEEDHAYLFQYGITPGLWEFRDKLSEFLTKRYGDRVNRKDLILTCGATHGLQLAMGTFLCPNSVIFVEEVTYMIALEAFKQYPMMKIVTVPRNADGVDTNAFERIAKKEKTLGKWNVSEHRPFWAMFYTIPEFHNPTGATMSQVCCESVVQVARRLDLVVFCDDVYNLLYYGNGYPPKRLLAYDTGMEGFAGGHVISNGTFSKIMAPGVRVGWLELPPRLTSSIKNSGILLSGGATNQYVSGIITSTLELGLEEKHLDLLVETFKARMTTMCDTLDKNLPPGCMFVRPKGGYFVWLELPKIIDAGKFISWCQENYKVCALAGNRFSVEGKFKNYLRLGIAFHNKDILESAGKKLCVALLEYMQNVTS